MTIDFMLAHRTLRTLRKGVLTVAAYANFFPVCYHDESGALAGLDVEVINAFAAAAGLRVHYIEHAKFNGIWDAPDRGTADVSIGGIANSKGRGTAKTEWTIPYFYVNRSVLFNKSDAIHSFPHDVHGVVVGTVGSTGWVDANLRLKRAGKIHLLVSGRTDADDVRALLSHKIQGVMRGDFVSRAIVHAHPHELGLTSWEIAPELVPSDGEIFAYPARSGSGVAVCMSAFLAELIVNGGLHQLMERFKLVE